jgi:hypothetical protein
VLNVVSIAGVSHKRKANKIENLSFKERIYSEGRSKEGEAKFQKLFMQIKLTKS